MKHIIIRCSKGMTLIELLIALSISSIVIAGIFSLFSFGNNIYGKGTDQYNIQANIRLAEDYITQQVRFATEVEILSGEIDPDDGVVTTLEYAIAHPEEIPAYINYIYFDEDTGSIKQLSRFTQKTFQIGESGSSLEFSKDTANNTLLRFNITGHDRSQVYNVDSEITCLNLHLSQIKIGGVLMKEVVGLPSGKAIYYKTISDYISASQKPVVSLDGNVGKKNDKKILDLIFDRDITDQLYDASGTTNLMIINQGVTDSSKYATIIKTGARTVRITIPNPGASDGRTIVFHVTFVDDTRFSYSVSYDNSTNWVIE